MPRTPTDLQILDRIYERYYASFTAFDEGKPQRSARIYVPIDVAELATHFGVDADIIFGRLYYHLEKKHGYKASDGADVPFFALRVGGDAHCVNFPYLASVLADLRSGDRKYRLATGMAVVSFVISVFNFFVARMR